MKTRIILSFLTGIVLGAGAMWFVVKKRTVNVFAKQYLVGVMDQANVALHIRAGKQMKLLTNIEAALPGYVHVVDHSFKEHPGSISALWMVKAYYERNEIAIPGEIKGVLESLPPRPPTACELRLRALDDDTATNIEGAASANPTGRANLRDER